MLYATVGLAMGVRRSKAPVPCLASCPITMRAEGEDKVSGSPATAAAVKKVAVVSNDICTNGLEEVVPMPTRLKGVYPPCTVMASAIKLKCRASTSMPYTSNTPRISFTMALRAASTPYALRIACTSLALMRFRSSRSSEGSPPPEASKPQIVLKWHPSVNKAHRLLVSSFSLAPPPPPAPLPHAGCSTTSRSTTCALLRPGTSSRTTVLLAAASTSATRSTRAAEAGANNDTLISPPLLTVTCLESAPPDANAADKDVDAVFRPSFVAGAAFFAPFVFVFFLSSSSPLPSSLVSSASSSISRIADLETFPPFFLLFPFFFFPPPSQSLSSSPSLSRYELASFDLETVSVPSSSLASSSTSSSSAPSPSPPLCWPSFSSSSSPLIAPLSSSSSCDLFPATPAPLFFFIFFAPADDATIPNESSPPSSSSSSSSASSSSATPSWPRPLPPTLSSTSPEKRPGLGAAWPSASWLPARLASDS
mmetsp:Transcript_25624/g.43696  ORF Transcript_25624/g.43696 Transcript_25624/m.43696 type:complete len:480 (-) Transcript_25624:1692-3131(-)